MAKILWHSCAPWAPSGYGQQTGIWVRKLAQMGHEVTVSSYWGLSGSPTGWEGVTVLPGFGHSYCSQSLALHAEAVRPDLVITLGDVWVLDASSLRPLPLAHWLPSDCRPMSLADRNVVDAGGGELIAMSRFGEDRFRTAGLRPVYVPHGIETSVFTPPSDRRALRDALGIAEGDFVIGMNSANNDAIRKAIPEQMLAFARFLEDHPEGMLALHTGVHADGGQDLDALAENLGITDRVRAVDQYRYSAGLVQPHELAGWYGAIDLLSSASYGEGFGIPVLEAQACGTPVLTTAASAMTELNPHGYSTGGEPFWNGVHKGWWVRPSVCGIAAAYEQAWRDHRDGRRDGLRDILRDHALRYDADLVAVQYMKPAVEELLARMGNRKARQEKKQ
jgi:glycosyltransferase involved in cell wall biosynthesis